MTRPTRPLARVAAALALAAVCAGCASEAAPTVPDRVALRFSVDVHSDVTVATLRWALHNTVTLESYEGVRGEPTGPGAPFLLDVGFSSGGPWVLVVVDGDGVSHAAVRCYTVASGGTVRDEILLQPATGVATDLDRDGWGRFDALACVDHGGAPCMHACEAITDRVDCDDTDITVSPTGFEICADAIDADCAGGDLSCGDADLDGASRCGDGRPGPHCDCDDRDARIHPGAEETCGDFVDQDCDGADALCDLDGDGWGRDPATGGPDCDDDDPTIHPGAAEIDCTSDRDCDGIVGEPAECLPDDLDGDGAPACGMPPEPGCDCRDCDPGVRPGALDRCGDGVDADCDGVDPACASGDLDGDGIASPEDCDDADPRVFPGAPDRCGDGIAQDCAADRSCSEDLDGDGWVESATCELSATRQPWSEDACDAADQDCDDTFDEIVAPPASVGTIVLAEGLRGCVRGDPRVACGRAACPVDLRSSAVHCGACRRDCNAGSALRRADRCVEGRCRCGAGSPCPPGRECCPGGVGCALPGGCPAP